MMKFAILFSLTASLVSCSTTKTNKPNKLISSIHLKMKKLPIVGKTPTGQEIQMGGFSGLMYIGKKNGEYIFKTITDRGPNGWNIGAERPFLMPDFSPQIVELKTNLKDESFEVVSTLELKKKNGKPLNGLPNFRKEENPIDVFGHMLSIDPDGMDTEALVSDGEGGYWIGEEYAPSLAHFDQKGILKRRLTPYNELPKIFSERKPNAGFEGIAKDGSRLFGFLQSPIPSDQRFSRIVEVNLESMKTTAEYYYEFEKGMSKIGDAISLGNDKFLVIEQNGKRGDESRKLITKITLKGQDAPVKKEVLIDLSETTFKSIEKVEGLAIIAPNKIAITKDNDFQIENITDPKTGMTPFNNEENELLIMEFSKEI